MENQKYLENLIEECKVFNAKSLANQKEYLELFPETMDESKISDVILSMNDEDMMKYFKASQGQLDNQVMFTKIASFIYFCKQTNIELDLSKLSEVERLVEFVSVYSPFETDYIVDDNNLKEKNIKKTELKFQGFKNSLPRALKITQ